MATISAPSDLQIQAAKLRMKADQRLGRSTDPVIVRIASYGDNPSNSPAGKGNGSGSSQG
jgi:hypothetical protein